jgi:N-acetylmuramoyl-L-alanine amidase
MAFKLAITAGHYLGTPGKRCMKALDPNETREWWLNDRIADRLQVLLSEYDGIEVLRTDDTTGKAVENLPARTNAANNFKADFYLSIHHNAGIGGGTGGGIETYIYNGGVSQATKDWQNDLYNELIKLTGLKGNRSDGTRSANFHEVRETSMPAVLMELGFMDSKVDVPIILTQDFAYKCAQACVNVIVRRAGLKKKQTQTTTTIAGTYKIVTEINKYANASDAKSKINSKGKLAAGTYYIFNKYPNGYNGMYNLTTDKTGAEAGSWINPSENIAPVQEETVQKIYRVRKAWADASSQKGAFSSLDNAKECCQTAGAGYKVFDWNGKEVYAYVTPVTPAPAPTPEPEQPKQEEVKKAVYELNFPQKHPIIEYDIVQTEGINDTECTRAILAIKKNNPNFDLEIAKAFFFLSDEYHIDPMRAISQSILETGWFKYQGSAVKPEHHNYCGLGVTSNGIEGGKFDTIENGVRAQLQHLYAYGCKDALPDGETTIVDPRFKYVTRGIAIYWEQLAGRWCVPGYEGNDAEASMKAGTTYGQKIDKIYEGLMATKVTDEDVKKYFAKEEPKVEPEVDPVVPDPVKPEDDDDNTLPEIDKNWLTKLIKMIIEILFDLFRSNKDN